MAEMSWLTLIAVRETLNAASRLFVILMRSRPHEGFPLVRFFIAALEAVSKYSHPVEVAPYIVDMLRRFEARCPGLLDAIHDDLYRGVVRHRDPLETPPAGGERGIDT